MGVKRKAEDVERNEERNEETIHGSTIFVSNLSYSTTQESLQAAFDDIAPVKTCFIVHEKAAHLDDATSSAASAKGPSKGVGYVTFAIKEDAESVINRFGESTEELRIDGRVVRVKWADRKPIKGSTEKSAGEPAGPKTSNAGRKERPQPAVAKDPDAIRTLIISNLPPDGLTNASLWKKIRKYTGAEKVQWPLGEDSSKALAVFDTPSNAAAAQPRLHAHVYKGSTLSVVLKKRADSLFRQRGKDPASSLTNNLKPSRAGRLIIRNVPWNITEDDLRALFIPCGPIHSVNIPKITPTAPSASEPPSSEPQTQSDPKPLARGFAFVWFLSQRDAARAIEKVNGSSLYAGYAADVKYANKSQIEGRRKIRKKMKSEDARVIAVDWALSKEKWAEAQKVLKENADNGEEEDPMDIDEEHEQAADEWTDESSSELTDAASVSEHDIDGAPADGKDDITSVGEHPTQPEEGSTLFIRNVPFEATDDELKTLFRMFGPIRYARVTMDPDTGRSRGTGFVSFWRLEDASKCLEEAERMKFDLDPEVNAKKNPFTLLAVDPSSSRAARFVLHGRTLDVTVAVSRGKAEELRETGERAREKKDKRNLYLMREGVIFPSSPAASTLTKSELERRQQSFQARRTLLRTNPSLYISRTRLSIRNLPTWVSERGLKRLAIHAKRAFDDEIKAGTRVPLSMDELEITEAEREALDSAKGKKNKHKGRPTGVKQAKIVRQADRVDMLTGKGRSKGYGFVEMDAHADALRVLRWLNNNRDAHKLLWAWWREEVADLAQARKEQLKGLGTGGGAPNSAPNRAKNASQPAPMSAAAQREELETRVKKLEARAAEMKAHDPEVSIKDGRTLHAEFSVENITVVKRRREKEATGDVDRPLPVKKPKKRQSSDERGSSETPERPAKKVKLDKKSSKAPNKGSQPLVVKKAGVSIGSLIGKKRRARKLARGK